MAFIQGFKTDFATLSKAVTELCDTEESYIVDKAMLTDRLIESENYTDYGFKSMGKLIGFPAPFVKNVADSNPELAKKIVDDRIVHYFNTVDKDFTVREFGGKIAGVVSNKYAYFDDDEVMEVIGNSCIKDLAFTNTTVTPERLHIRALDKDSFHIVGDDSPMYFAYFIDNSMVGGSAFKVRLGVFRQACTNGLIIPQSEFVICKQVHRGDKDISSEFNASIEMINEKRDAIIDILNEAAETKSKIEKLSEEYRADYLSKRLNTNKAETEKIIMLYNITYGGQTRYALMQAVTEFARDIKDIDRREFLEAKALKVA